MIKVSPFFQGEIRNPEIQTQIGGQANQQSVIGTKSILAVFEGSKLGALDVSFEVLVPCHTSSKETFSDTWEALLGKRIEVDVKVKPKNQATQAND